VESIQQRKIGICEFDSWTKKYSRFVHFKIGYKIDALYTRNLFKMDLSKLQHILTFTPTVTYPQKIYTTPRTWHPHIYHKTPTAPTPHSITDILGLPQDRAGEVTDPRIDDLRSPRHRYDHEPLNGSVGSYSGSDRDTSDEGSSTRSSVSPVNVVDVNRNNNNIGKRRISLFTRGSLSITTNYTMCVLIKNNRPLLRTACTESHPTIADRYKIYCRARYPLLQTYKNVRGN
jgi:hypothetical protein